MWTSKEPEPPSMESSIDEAMEGNKVSLLKETAQDPDIPVKRTLPKKVLLLIYHRFFFTVITCFLRKEW